MLGEVPRRIKQSAWPTKCCPISYGQKFAFSTESPSDTQRSSSHQKKHTLKAWWILPVFLTDNLDGDIVVPDWGFLHLFSLNIKTATASQVLKESSNLMQRGFIIYTFCLSMETPPTPEKKTRVWFFLAYLATEGPIIMPRCLGSEVQFYNTFDGRNPAPVDMVNIINVKLSIGFYTSQVVRDFFHQQQFTSQTTTITVTAWFNQIFHGKGLAPPPAARSTYQLQCHFHTSSLGLTQIYARSGGNIKKCRMFGDSLESQKPRQKKLDMALLAVWPRWKDQGPQIYIKIQSTSWGPLMVFIFQPYAPNLDMLESRSATKKTQKRRQARPSRFPPHPTTTPTAVNSCFPSDPEQSRTKHRFISNAPGLGTKNMETLLLQVSGIPSFSGPRTWNRMVKWRSWKTPERWDWMRLVCTVFSMCFQCLDLIIANRCFHPDIFITSRNHSHTQVCLLLLWSKSVWKASKSDSVKLELSSWRGTGCDASYV